MLQISSWSLGWKGKGLIHFPNWKNKSETRWFISNWKVWKCDHICAGSDVLDDCQREQYINYNFLPSTKVSESLSPAAWQLHSMVVLRGLPQVFWLFAFHSLVLPQHYFLLLMAVQLIYIGASYQPSNNRSKQQHSTDQLALPYFDGVDGIGLKTIEHGLSDTPV